jgi:tetratricopeptide (TPR) repeat protein
MKIEWIEKYLTEAEELIINNEVEHGIAILDNLLYAEPGYCDLHNYLGWAYLYYGGDAKRAELHLKMAMRFNAEYHAPYLHMATLCLREQKYNDLIKYAELGLTKPQARKVALYEIIGNAYELKGEFRKAIKAYKAASMSSMASTEMNGFTEGIKRCWKKRVRLCLHFNFLCIKHASATQDASGSCWHLF